MKKISSFLLWIICPFILFGQEVHIVPKPTRVIFEQGEFKINKRLGYQIFGIAPGSIDLSIEQLQAEFQNNFAAILSESKQAEILIGIPGKNERFKQLCEKNQLLKDGDIGEQGYELKISRNQILLAAETAQGLFYGVQSLKQLIRGSEKSELPCLTIHDAPAFKFRAVMDDISRGPVPSTAFLKYQIRRASELKLNLFSYYIEHVVKTKSYPEFAPAKGAISIEEWNELSKYAAKYHIQLIGAFQSLGHFEKILSHPKFQHLGATNRLLNPGTPESFQFLENIYGEMAPAFSSPFFNVNCDETWDLGRGKTKMLADSIGIARLYSNHINGISKILSSQGKTMMMWGDIVLAHPEIFKLIPKETILLPWEYGDKDSFADFIDPMVENGFDFMVCPGVVNSNRLYPYLHQSVNNIRKFVAEGYKKGAIGVLNTVWDDGGRHSFNRDWYGVAYGADQSWNPGNRPITDYNTCFSRGIYGDHSETLPKAINKLMELNEMEATQEMNNQIFWSTLIPERGEEITFNMAEWQAVLDIANQADSIIQSASLKNYADELQYTRFVINQYKYLAEGRMQLLAAAGKYKKACIIQFENPKETEKLLEEVTSILSTCQIQFLSLKDTLERLWKSENRDYWLTYALDPYNEVLSDYSDLQKSVTNAFTLFKQQESLPFPKDVRLDISEQEGSYFQYWLLCGPFPIENETGPLPDFLETMGGEAHAKPIPGFSFNAKNGNEYSWIKYASPINDQINFKTIYEDNTEVLAYAYCTIESEESKEVTATFGSNDGIEIFCNGEKVFSIREKRSVIPDENSCRLPLHPGKNHILLKVDNWQAGWGFSFRLAEQKVRNHKHKYRIISTEK